MVQLRCMAREFQMPSSAVQTFSDPDQYAAAIRAAQAEQKITGRGQFAAKIVKIDFNRLWMQRFSENLPRIIHAAHIPEGQWSSSALHQGRAC
jgi:hypothetical protein